MKMGRIGESVGILYPSIAVAVYLKPEYAINNSRLTTVVVLFALLTISRLIYKLNLYPKYFSPIKNIPTPPVSFEYALIGETRS